GLTSSVWIGYRFLHDRRWTRRAAPRPELEIPKPPAVDELPRTAPARSAAPLASVAATVDAARPVGTMLPQPGPASYAGVATQPPPTPGRRADDTPRPTALRPSQALKTRSGRHRKQQ